MKTLISFLFFLLVNVSLAQLKYPYFQNFEDNSFYENEFIGLDVNAPPPAPTDVVDIEGGEGYTWALSDTYSSAGYSLKLTVHEHDNTKYATWPLSRSEVQFNMDNQNISYYSFDIYFPNDSEFIENEYEDSHHIIQQLHTNRWNSLTSSPYNLFMPDINGNVVDISNVIATLGLIYEPNSSSNDLYRNLNFWIDDPQDIKANKLGLINDTIFKQKRQRLKIIDAVKKGEWNNIILKINWSVDSSEGYIQFWINEKPVVLDSMGNPLYNEHIASVHNSNEEPLKIYSGNIAQTADPIPIKISGIFKAGHYRQKIPDIQSLYFDNFTILKDFPAETSSNNLTSLTEEYCNKILDKNLFLEAYKVNNELNYKFRFSKYGLVQDVSSAYFHIDSPENVIDVSNHFNFYPGRKYNVEVRTSGAYGQSCLIEIPTKTKLLDKYCNNFLPVDDYTLECYSIPNVTNYKFKFTDISNNAEYWIDSPVSKINLSEYSFILPGKQFIVKVRINDFAYGEECLIKIPNTIRLTDTYCNMPVATPNLTISTFFVPNASNYKFHFIDTVSPNMQFWIDSNSPKIDLINSPSIQPGKTYNVEVRTDGAYGEMCTITLPSSLDKGKKESPKSSLIIVPNPASNYVEININDNYEISEVEVRNLQGRVMLSEVIHSQKAKLQLKHFVKGIYQLIVRDSIGNMYYDQLIVR
ncbi:MAG TPA: heparin lyase I family protein [Moheibacter sp.]|nr:heparin lyase I family protein [Moheibacter sp.]